MREIIVKEYYPKDEVELMVQNKTIRVKGAKKVKKLFNRSIDKKEEYKNLKKILGLSKGSNIVSKQKILEAIANYKEKVA